MRNLIRDGASFEVGLDGCAHGLVEGSPSEECAKVRLELNFHSYILPLKVPVDIYDILGQHIKIGTGRRHFPVTVSELPIYLVAGPGIRAEDLEMAIKVAAEGVSFSHDHKLAPGH